MLKGKRKKRMLNILTTLFVGCGLCGVLCILGTAGSSDIEKIGIPQILTQSMQGFLLCFISYVLCFVRNALQ